MKTYAIVTGSSRGLGEAIASEMLAAGMDVLGISRGPAAATLSEHVSYNHKRLDLADLEATRAGLEELPALTQGEKPQHLVLVNNAGLLGGLHSLEHIVPAQLLQAMTVNATTPIWLMGFALRAGCARTTIVNISSGAATTPYPGWGSYCSSKAALEMAGRVLAEEHAEVPHLAGRDLRVLSYAPGVVATEMQRLIREADEREFPRRERFLELHRSGGLVDAREPARHLLALLQASDAPAYLATRYQAQS